MPFNKNFYSDAQEQGLSAEKVYENSLRYRKKGSAWFRKVKSVENSFLILIKIGILRREVDGQGLTSKIRLTPMARQILQTTPEISQDNSGKLERFKYWFYFLWLRR